VHLFDHLAEVDADAEHRLVRIAGPDGVVAEFALQIDGEAHGLESAVERRLHGVALDVEDATLVVADQGFEEVDAPHHAPMGTELVPLHRAAVVHNISKQNCRQTLPYLVATRRGHTLEAPVSLVFPHLSTIAGTLLGRRNQGCCPGLGARKSALVAPVAHLPIAG
jgi:hypothetical protein